MPFYDNIDDVPNIDLLVDVNNLEGETQMGKTQILGSQIKDQSILADQISVYTLGDTGNHIVTDLQTEILALASGAGVADTGLSGEIYTRASADTVITNNLSTELVTRASADTVLTNGLSTELVTRASADTVLKNNLSTELITARSAELANSTAISTELVTRASADTVLTNGLSTETSTARAAESANSTAISTELVTRASADTVLTNGLSTELVTRASADTVLSTSIVTSESVAKGYADSQDVIVLASAKSYADSIASGLNLHEEVRLATDGIPLPACTYVAGVNPIHPGVGATLTGDAGGLLVIDGKDVVATNRVLVMGQANAVHNGIYTVTATGGDTSMFVLTRALDYDGDPQGEASEGDYFFVTDGDTQRDASYTQVTLSPDVVGTSELVFALFGRAEQIIAGAGLKRTANTLDIDIVDISPVITAVDSADLLIISNHTGDVISKITAANLIAPASSGISTEASTARSAELANSTAISTEVVGRTAAVSTVTSGLSTELVTRASADTVLTNDLSTELVTRASADTVLTSGLSTELATRASADTVLTNNLSTEVVGRGLAVSTVTSNLSTELVTRASADTVLTNGLSTELVTRASADTVLTSSISTEVINRGAAISTATSAAVVREATVLSDAQDYTDLAVGNLPVRAKQIFTATAGQTIFVLTYTPVAVTELVFLNGLAQVEGDGASFDYELSLVAKSITFSYPLAVGEVVVATYQHVV